MPASLSGIAGATDVQVISSGVSVTLLSAYVYDPPAVKEGSGGSAGGCVLQRGAWYGVGGLCALIILLGCFVRRRGDRPHSM